MTHSDIADFCRFHGVNDDIDRGFGFYELSLASERVTSLRVQRSNQETPEKNTILLQPKSVRKIVEDLRREGMRPIAITQLGLRTKQANSAALRRPRREKRASSPRKPNSRCEVRSAVT